MKTAITDLLESAKILAKANGDQILCYLIDIALLEAREIKAGSAVGKKGRLIQSTNPLSPSTFVQVSDHSSALPSL